MSSSADDLKKALASLRMEHQRIVAQLRHDHDQVQEIARSAWRVQEEERRRLARELHDGLGQTLTALKNDLASLAETDEPGLWRARIRTALQLCSDCLADTREMSRLLRPPVLDDLGLEPALKQLARMISDRRDLSVEVAIRGPAGELDTELSTLIYRIAQEALTNAAKHASGSFVLLRLTIEEGSARLVIIDDGEGFDLDRLEPKAGGFGLHAMQERAALFGGQVQIDTAPGEGTRIKVLIPRRQSTMNPHFSQGGPQR